MELDGPAEVWLHPVGIYPGSFGSSGMVSRNLSSLALKSSVLVFKFLIDLGRILKILAPWIWKLFSLID